MPHPGGCKMHPAFLLWSQSQTHRSIKQQLRSGTIIHQEINLPILVPNGAPSKHPPQSCGLGERVRSSQPCWHPPSPYLRCTTRVINEYFLYLIENNYGNHHTWFLHCTTGLINMLFVTGETFVGPSTAICCICSFSFNLRLLHLIVLGEQPC